MDMKKWGEGDAHGCDCTACVLGRLVVRQTKEIKELKTANAVLTMKLDAYRRSVKP